MIVLLDNSALIETRDHYGRTALWWAARDGHTNVLIARGADVDAVYYGH